MRLQDYGYFLTKFAFTSEPRTVLYFSAPISQKKLIKEYGSKWAVMFDTYKHNVFKKSITCVISKNCLEWRDNSVDIIDPNDIRQDIIKLIELD